MCTLAAFVGASPVHPIVVAANRDELLARPAVPSLPLDAARRASSPRATSWPAAPGSA